MVDRCARLLVVSLLATGAVVLATPASNAAPALTVSRTSVIAGEYVTVTGSVGGKAPRSVVLQRRQKGVWTRVVTGRTATSGAFRFRFRTPTTGPSNTVVRVLAPAVSGGHRQAAAVTDTRTLTRVPTSGSIAAPSPVAAFDAVTVRGTFTPARPGRPTQVQRWDGHAWSTIAVGKQDRAGRSIFRIGLVTPQTQGLRVVAPTWSGAVPTASPLRAITVLPADSSPPELEVPGPSGDDLDAVVEDPPPAIEEAAAVPTGVLASAGDRAVTVTWDPSTAAGLEGHVVYMASSLSGPWARLTSAPIPGDQTSTTVRGLSNGASYAFAVTAVYARGDELIQSSGAFTELVSPAAPSTADPALTDDCGELVQKVDGSSWRCTLAEDFDGSGFDRTHWFAQQTFSSGTTNAFACYRNTPDTIAVADGVLSLSVVRRAAPVSCRFGNESGSTDIVAGSLMSYQRFTQQYGRFEARIKTAATTLPGLQEAFWMWPDNRVPSVETWPTAGEIDVTETYSAYPGLAIPFLHYSADAGGVQPGTNTAYCAADRGVWNTYTLIWTADRIEIQVNGRTCLINTSGDRAFDKPYLLAFSAMLGTGSNAYDGRIPLPATMQIDYVRAWE